MLCYVLQFFPVFLGTQFHPLNPGICVHLFFFHHWDITDLLVQVRILYGHVVLELPFLLHHHVLQQQDGLVQLGNSGGGLLVHVPHEQAHIVYLFLQGLFDLLQLDVVAAALGPGLLLDRWHDAVDLGRQGHELALLVLELFVDLLYEGEELLGVDGDFEEVAGGDVHNLFLSIIILKLEYISGNSNILNTRA